VIKTIPLQHSALSKFLSILDSCLENLPARTPSFTIIYAIEIWLLSGHRLGDWRDKVWRLSTTCPQFLMLHEVELDPADR